LSHVDPKVNDEFHKLLEQMYGDEKTSQAKAVCGKQHDYLAMILDYNTPGKVALDNILVMVKDFPEEVQKEKNPWNKNLLKVDGGNNDVPKKQAEDYHTFIAKRLFVC
jgi:hypothetical protein